MRNRYLITIGIIALVSAITYSLPLTSQKLTADSLLKENLDVYSSQNELLVGLAELDYPPFYFEKDGEIYGAATEIAQHVAKNLGHTLVFKRYPWKRVQHYLKIGTIDMVILYFKTPERAQFVEYTDTPHIDEESYLFVAKGTKIKYKGSLDDLRFYRFGSVRGYSHGEKYDNAENLEKQETLNEISLIKMLIKGRFDIALGNRAAINQYAQSENLQDKINFLVPPIDIRPNYFAFSKSKEGARELAKAFSSEVKVFIKTEAYRDILTKYNLD